MPSPLFFHVDLDAFFAAVEVLDDPSLAGKPLIIGHKGPRSVVSTCSYEARTYGVHSAMPMSQAMRLCPQAICLPGNMKRYSAKSKEVMAIIDEMAPQWIQASIDEADLDMTGTERLYGGAREAALLLKRRVRQETGLTISVGVASSRFIAKLASDYRKPDGLTIIPEGMEEDFIDAVGLEKLWGVGKVTCAKLRQHGIRTTRDLRSMSIGRLKDLFGEAQAAYLYKVARGQDPGIYSTESRSHSISAERTFFPDLIEKEAIELYLLELSQEVGWRSMDEHFMARTIGVRIRYPDFTTVSIQTTPDEGIYNSSEIYEWARRLFWQKYRGGGVRLLGVGLYQMYSGDEVEQGEFFKEDAERRRRLERAILDMRRSGAQIQRASSLLKDSQERLK